MLPMNALMRTRAKLAILAILAVLLCLYVFTVGRSFTWLPSASGPVVHKRNVFTTIQTASGAVLNHPNDPEFYRDPDNFLVGKSCLRDEGKRSWNCRDCGMLNKYSTWTDCPLASRRHGKCSLSKSSRHYQWDDPVIRRRSDFQPTRFQNPEDNLIGIPGYPPPLQRPIPDYQQVACGALEDCWDLTRCVQDQPLAVYAYRNNSMAYNYTRLAATKYPDLIQHVLNPQDGCMLVISCDSFDNYTDMTISNPFWNNGRNHFIFKATEWCFFYSHTDRPGPTNYNYQQAAIASSSIQYANMRRGYDIPVLLTMREERALTVPMETISQLHNNDRSLLLVFRGQLLNWGHPWWKHRWMAFEYWDDQDDVVVDLTCGRKGYDEKNAFVQMMLQAKFAFCPGGAGVHSYRVGEALGLGAIPVVTPDLPEPFDWDWSGCWIRVSEARIVDLPRLLRQISAQEIKERQARCQYLFEAGLGWKESSKKKGFVLIEPDERTFLSTMRVWSARVESVLRFRKRMGDMEAP